jgi:hypothetical protein
VSRCNDAADAGHGRVDPILGGDTRAPDVCKGTSSLSLTGTLGVNGAEAVDE